MMTKTSALAVVLMSTLGHVAHADTGDDQRASLAAAHARVDEPGAHWTAGSHVSFYKADKLSADTLRMSVYTAYNF